MHFLTSSLPDVQFWARFQRTWKSCRLMGMQHLGSHLEAHLRSGSWLRLASHHSLSCRDEGRSMCMEWGRRSFLKVVMFWTHKSTPVHYLPTWGEVTYKLVGESGRVSACKWGRLHCAQAEASGGLPRNDSLRLSPEREPLGLRWSSPWQDR